MSSINSKVQSFSILGRLANQRQRCLGMTDTERQWRAQFLKDQILSREEPKNIPELYKETTHFVRRLWRTPMWNLEKAASSIMGKTAGYYTRHFVGKMSGILVILYVGVYYMKYHANDWTNFKSWEMFNKQRKMFPFEPDFPNYKKKEKEDFFDQGFRSSPYAKKIESVISKDSSSVPEENESICLK